MGTTTAKATRYRAHLRLCKKAPAQIKAKADGREEEEEEEVVEMAVPDVQVVEGQDVRLALPQAAVVQDAVAVGAGSRLRLAMVLERVYGKFRWCYLVTNEIRSASSAGSDSTVQTRCSEENGEGVQKQSRLTCVQLGSR